MKKFIMMMLVAICAIIIPTANTKASPNDVKAKIEKAHFDVINTDAGILTWTQSDATPVIIAKNTATIKKADAKVIKKAATMDYADSSPGNIYQNNQNCNAENNTITTGINYKDDNFTVNSAKKLNVDTGSPGITTNQTNDVNITDASTTTNNLPEAVAWK